VNCQTKPVVFVFSHAMGRTVIRCVVRRRKNRDSRGKQARNANRTINRDNTVLLQSDWTWATHRETCCRSYLLALDCSFADYDLNKRPGRDCSRRNSKHTHLIHPRATLRAGRRASIRPPNRSQEYTSANKSGFPGLFLR